MLLWRAAQWYCSGNRTYTRQHFEKVAAKWDPKELDTPLTGRVCIITGANSGLGKETALSLAQRKAIVHLVCRDEEKGKAALQEIREKTSNTDVHLHILDLTQINELSKFADEFSSPVHVLVNNAGMMLHERKITNEEIDSNFACNVLAPFVLTYKLLPLLEASGDARVIFVSSGGMYTTALNVKDLENRQGKYDGTLVYAHNKRALVCLAGEFARKYQEKSILFASMHPGWADTPAVQSAMPSFYERQKSSLRTAAQGADSIIWLASSATLEDLDERKKINGKFIFDREVRSEHLTLSWTTPSEKDLESLWKYCEALMTRCCPKV